MALIGHGEVFAASARDGGEAIRVTQTPGPEAQVAWAPDSSRIVYVGERDAVNHLFLYDFAQHVETQLTRDSAPDQAPRFSPDGKSLAFVRDRRELRVIDPESKQERLVVAGSLGGGFRARWWRRGMVARRKWIAYSASGDRGLRNLHVCAGSGRDSAPDQLSRERFGRLHPWSPDGKFLLFATNQRTETPQIARIDLTRAYPILPRNGSKISSSPILLAKEARALQPTASHR